MTGALWKYNRVSKGCKFPADTGIGSEAKYHVVSMWFKKD